MARPALDPILVRPRKSDVSTSPMAAPASSAKTSHAVGPVGVAEAGSCSIRETSALRPETLDFSSSSGVATYSSRLNTSFGINQTRGRGKVARLATGHAGTGAERAVFLGLDL